MSRAITKPWGYEIIWAETDKYVGKILHITAGHRLSLQYHQYKTETIRIQSGSITLQIDGRCVTMHPGDAYHIPAGQIHRMSAITDADVIEVSTPELTDIIRLEDDYHRI